MLVSIIIPVYNSQSYLEQCVDSVIQQSFQDWECILVDDGSTDGSSILCDEYIKKDQRLKVIHQENLGVSAARNTGIEIAKGKYLTFVDSDDWIDEDYLLHLVTHSKETDLTVSGYIKTVNGKIIKEHFLNDSMCYILQKENANSFICMLQQDFFYVPVCKLYRKDVVDCHHIRFPDNCDYGEDLLFNFLYMEHISKVTYSPFKDYHYRIQNTGTLTTAFRPDRFENDHHQWCIVKSFCENKLFLTTEAKQYLGRRLWGIIYDGLFLHYKPSWILVKSIMNIPEIRLLSSWNVSFQASWWIKLCVIHRQSFLLYILLKLRKS